MGDLVAGFVLLGVAVCAVVLSYEDKIVSKLEQILGIRIKRCAGHIMDCYTYNGLPWVLLIPALILTIAMFYPIVVGYDNFPAFIGLLFLFIYPLVVMIIRNGTFDDYSIPSEENPVYVGSDVVIEGPGYNPVYYWLFSLSIGGVSTIWGFSMLNFSDSLNQGFFLIFMGLLFQTLVLFPDLINWISPVDIRTKNGIYLMSVVTVAMVIFLMFLRVVSMSVY